MPGQTFITVTVSSAGTRVRVTSTPTPVRRIYFQAGDANTQSVYLGGSDVSSTVHGRDIHSYEDWLVEYQDGRGDLSDWYVDADTNNNKLLITGILP